MTLKSLIKSVLAEHPYAGPEELAVYVAAATPAANIRDYYNQLLIRACRTVVNKERRGIKPPPKPSVIPRQKPTPSPKLSERRSWWAEMLHNEMHVGAGVRKPMADCTVDDLRFCIDERGQTINRIEEQIANLRALIDMMVQRGARTVADLPEQQQWKTAS